MEKLFGMQDIIIGNESFDNKFIIKGDNEILLRRLLLNTKISYLIDKQPKIVFKINDPKSMIGPKYNDNESELSFVIIGIIKDKERLKNLFELFIKTLNEFEIIGITINQTPEVKLYKN